MNSTKILTEEVQKARFELARIGRLLFQRQLTDAAGGNISVRVGDLVVMSPTLAGQMQQWQIEAEDVLVLDMDRNILVGEGNVSRESNVHFGLHQTFGEYGTAVMHAHPHDLMVFAALARPMPVALEANLKFGEIPVVDYAPAHSPRLAENVVGRMRGQEDRIKKHAFGIIAPWHGVFVMGKHLDAAFDAVERFNTNAHCLLMAHASGLSNDMLAPQREALETAAANFGKKL